MALPADGQNANGLTKVTQIPAGKELMFIDPTTNEGGIITLEDLTKQILNGLASQAFALDAGQMTLPAALNYLYGKTTSFELGGAVNSSVTTKIDVSKLHKNKHYAVFIAIGHVQGDYAACGIGHFEYAKNYVGFSIFKMPGNFPELDFTFENDGVNPNINITTISSTGVDSSGTIVFFG